MIFVVILVIVDGVWYWEDLMVVFNEILDLVKLRVVELVDIDFMLYSCLLFVMVMVVMLYGISIIAALVVVNGVLLV